MNAMRRPSDDAGHRRGHWRLRKMLRSTDFLVAPSAAAIMIMLANISASRSWSAQEVGAPQDRPHRRRIDIGQQFVEPVERWLPLVVGVATAVPEQHVADFVADDLVDVVVGGSRFVQDDVFVIAGQPQPAGTASQRCGIGRHKPDWTGRARRRCWR